MPQVIIHASSSIRPEDKAQLVRSIRESIPQLLNVAEHIGQVMLYEIPEENRSTHSTRNRRFIFVEVSMYPGRTAEMKLNFLQNLVLLINRYTGVDAEDINCVIHEIPPENYYGGVSHKYIEELK
ncbi:MAG: tautomerase family protein, partial [Thermodesulfobacteriota bacterium]|nr:tautomerase family protein [Thermodesulfobacteriota bacterium]